MITYTNSLGRHSRVGAMGHQGGIALVVTLIFLALLTLIGVASMRTTTIEEQMAGNLRTSAIGQEAAEAALRVGEKRIQGLGSEPTKANCAGYGGCYPSESYETENDDANWVGTDVAGAKGTQYRMRYVRFENNSITKGTEDDGDGRGVFHVTACSQGAAGGSNNTGCADGEDMKSVLQTTYKRKF